MDAARLQAIRERCEAATEGPWTKYTPPSDTDDAGVLEPWVKYPDGDDISVLTHPNADFIAHARSDIPDLLDAVEGHEEALDKQADLGLDVARRLVVHQTTALRARLGGLEGALARLLEQMDDAQLHDPFCGYHIDALAAARAALDQNRLGGT